MIRTWSVGSTRCPTCAGWPFTDTRPATLNVSLSTLRNVDEDPYRVAINAGVKLIMVSWAVYPALDANRPATLVCRITCQHTIFESATVCSPAVHGGRIACQPAII